MSDNPLVSVVCPAYNCERFIEPALQSVFAQSYRPIEVIVVDDGSTDSTPALVRNYREVCYLHQMNRGPSAARNRGICSARGEFVAFLDLDDLWMPEKLAKQMATLESCPEAALVFSDMRLFDSAGHDKLTMFQKYRLTPDFFGDESVVDRGVAKLVIMNFIPTASVLVRKATLIEVGGFDEKFRKSEDWDLWLRMAIHRQIAYIPEPMTLKRVHEVNTSRDAEGMNVASLQVLEKFTRDHQHVLDPLGIDMVSVLRDGYRNLGYFYLRQISLTEARQALGRSLSLGFRSRALFYFLSTFLGRGLIGSLVRARG